MTKKRKPKERERVDQPPIPVRPNGKEVHINQAAFLWVDEMYLKACEIRIRAAGWNTPRWIYFCRRMLSMEYRVYLKSSKTTVSKYIYVVNGEHCLKVRYSNHKPNKKAEKQEDSDFYVGVGNKGVLKTGDVIPLVENHFLSLIG